MAVNTARAGLSLLIAVAGVLALPLPLSAQSSIASYTVHGSVRLPDGSGASRVNLRITSHTGFSRLVFTDDMGRFEVRDIPRGRHYLAATNPADPRQTHDPVEVETSRAFSGRLLVNIFLRYRVDETTSGKETKSTISVVEASQRVPKPAQKAFEKAVRFGANQEVDKALESFSESIELFPEYFQALAERGHLRIGKGDYGHAAADFSQALRLNDRYEPAVRGSGICKFQQGRLTDAVAELERATTLDPGIASTYLFLGIANVSLDRREAGRKALEKALSLDAALAARAHVHLANLYLKEDRFKDAATELDAYLSAAPNAPDAEKLKAVRAQIDSRLAKPH